MFHLKLDGGADNGWIGEIHDGNNLVVHNPGGETLLDALSNMLKTHFGIVEPGDEAKG